MAKTDSAARRQEALATAIEPRLKAIIEKQLDLAEKGDPSAAKLVLGYYAAMPTVPERMVTLPGLAEAKTLVDKANIVLNATAAGNLSPASAEAFMKSLQVLSNAVALSEFADRIAALERAAAARNGGALPVAPRVNEPPLPLA